MCVCVCLCVCVCVCPLSLCASSSVRTLFQSDWLLWERQFLWLLFAVQSNQPCVLSHCLLSAADRYRLVVLIKRTQKPWIKKSAKERGQRNIGVKICAWSRRSARSSCKIFLTYFHPSIFLCTFFFFAAQRHYFSCGSLLFTSLTFFLSFFPFLSAPFAYSIPSCSASVMQPISCVCALKQRSGDSPGFHLQKHSVVPNTLLLRSSFPTSPRWLDRVPADQTGTIKTHLLCWFRGNPNRRIQAFIVDGLSRSCGYRCYNK